MIKVTFVDRPEIVRKSLEEVEKAIIEELEDLLEVKEFPSMVEDTETGRIYVCKWSIKLEKWSADSQLKKVLND